MDVPHDDIFALAQADAQDIAREQSNVFEAFFAMRALALLGKEVIAPQHAEARQHILHRLGLEYAYEKFLIELCWSADDIQDFFQTPGNESEYAVFAARAGKAGLNIEKFLNALLAIAYIDDTNKHPRTLEKFHRFVIAEYTVMPERFAARQAQQQHARKLRIKAILGECGLAPEPLFTRLGTGFGPARGVVMEGVYEILRGESQGDTFGIHAEYIRDCAKKAAEKFATEGLSV